MLFAMQHFFRGNMKLTRHIYRIVAGILSCYSIGVYALDNSQLQVTASVAFKAPYLEMVQDFERRTGAKVVTNWLPTVEIVELIKKGEAGDLVILSSSNIDDLTQKGFLVSGSKVDYVSSGIGIGIRKNSPKPNIQTTVDLKQTLLDAKSIAYSTGPSGVYLSKLFQEIGVAEEIRPKLKIIQGEPVGAVVERGEADIGFQQIPEILSVPAIEYLGPLPAEVQYITTFAFAIPSNKSNTQLVQSWITTLKSPKAAPIIQRYGLNPSK
jgi:molybdate transport system substrate-binding protein